jgi:hypothetical protein
VKLWTALAATVLAVVALLMSGESRAATVTVSVDMSPPGSDAPLVRNDFLGVSIPYYLVPSMLSYSPLNVAAHRRFALPWPAPPAPRNQKTLSMLAAMGQGTLRVGGTAQEQMCYFDQPLGRGCSFRSRIRTRHYALIKDFLLDLEARNRHWKAILGVPLADGSAGTRKTILKGINLGFTGKELAGAVRGDNRRLILGIAVGHEPNALTRHDYRNLRTHRRHKRGRGANRHAKRQRQRGRWGRFATNQRYRVAARRLLNRGNDRRRARHYRWAGRIMAGPGLPTYSTWRRRLGDMIEAGGYRFVTQSVYQARGRRGCIEDMTSFPRSRAECWPDPRAGSTVDKRARFLLNEAPLRRLAGLVKHAVVAARGRGVYAVESNSVSKRGSVGVSDTMVNALWGLDWMFTMASQGVRGVNIQHADRWNGEALLRPGGDGFAPYNPIGLSDGTIGPRPLYYSMVLFGQLATGTAVGQGHSRIEPLSGTGTGSRLREGHTVTPIKGWRVNSAGTNTLFLVNKDAAVTPAGEDDVVRLAPTAPAADCYAIWLRGGDGTITSKSAALGNPMSNRWAEVDANGNIPAWYWRRIEPENGQYVIPVRRGEAAVVRFW